jgi:hypothetical protein
MVEITVRGPPTIFSEGTPTFVIRGIKNTVFFQKKEMQPERLTTNFSML